MLKYLNPSYYLRSAQRGGYTIDQTILIVVIIAILITLVIITIGWNLINRTSGTKVASQFTQFEDAIGQFYGEYRYWPHSMTTGTAVTALTTPILIAGGTPTGAVLPTGVTSLKNFLPGIKANGVSNLVNSNNGQIKYFTANASTWVGGTSAANSRIVLQFDSVPFDEAKEADEAIDGKPGTPTSGRFVYSTAACASTGTAVALGATALATPAAPTSGAVFACFVANSVL